MYDPHPQIHLTQVTTFWSPLLHHWKQLTFLTEWSNSHKRFSKTSLKIYVQSVTFCLNTASTRLTGLMVYRKHAFNVHLQEGLNEQVGINKFPFSYWSFPWRVICLLPLLGQSCANQFRALWAGLAPNVCLKGLHMDCHSGFIWLTSKGKVAKDNRKNVQTLHSLTAIKTQTKQRRKVRKSWYVLLGGKHSMCTKKPPKEMCKIVCPIRPHPPLFN